MTSCTTAADLVIQGRVVYDATMREWHAESMSAVAIIVDGKEIALTRAQSDEIDVSAYLEDLIDAAINASAYSEAAE